MVMEISSAIQKATTYVTKEFTKQKKREERDFKAVLNRSFLYTPKIPKKDILFDVLEEAYEKATDYGRLPASQRQIYYACRNLWLQSHPKMNLSYNTFADYLAEFLYLTNFDWRVLKDPRGNLIEPHTKLTIPLGTAEVDKYLSKSFGHQQETMSDRTVLNLRYPTAGPQNRFSALLYLEKEGFNGILEDADIPNRFDLALASAKGQSVVAVRRTIDVFCHQNGIPLLTVHDFDQAGFSIRENLTKDSIRYEFANKVRSIDLGLRLEDVERYDLQSEPCNLSGYCIGGGATQREKEFLLSGRRVELNAFTSPQFVAWIESKLMEVGIPKVIPGAATLLEAYRRAWARVQLQQHIDDSSGRLNAQARDVVPRVCLVDAIRKRLKNQPSMAWDDAILEIVKESLHRT